MTESLPASLAQLLGQLQSLSQVSLQSQWRWGSSECLELEHNNWEALELALGNEKGFITWPKGQQVCWLVQKIVVPSTLSGYPLEGLILRLALTWWAEEADIYVNGQLSQQGDLFDSQARILLTEVTQPGQTFHLVLKLISPAHDIGGLMQSHLLYEKKPPEVEPGFIADELRVLSQYLAVFEPEKLAVVESSLRALPWPQVGTRSIFEPALQTLRETLKPLAVALKGLSFHLLGHAHLDMAWLWPLAQTWAVGERTFRSVLSLQEEFTDLIFGHTSPALYEWIEIHRPELFAQIQRAVVTNRWELLGGMWVEPDANLLGGESWVRQLLYGQRYFCSRFGRLAKVAWLPDSFGFCQQLPQLFQQAGIDYFVTGKLHWNDTNSFPYGAFYWRSPNGSELLTVMSPPNVAGVMNTQPQPMINYALEWQKQTSLKAMLWLPGVGDHGGGPSRDMWQVKARWQNSDFFPQIKTSRAEDYLQEVHRQLQAKNAPIPKWQEDLYLELHRGCYTNHADQKYFNRQAETLLYEAELWSSLATLMAGAPYPRAKLETLWKKVLLNQFHDILPGTSIPAVFAEANAEWKTVLEAGAKIRELAFASLAQQILLPLPPVPQAQPLLVFNSLSQGRDELVILPFVARIYSARGQLCLTQITAELETLFWAESLPPLGYGLYWWVKDEETVTLGAVNPQPILDNGQLSVTVDVHTGDLVSVIDRRAGREILAAPANQLQFFQDHGQYWDAWNIAPDYADHPLPPARLQSLVVLEKGPLRWRLRVEKVFGQSWFQQDYVLEYKSPILKVSNQAHWQERHILVKVAFPLSFASDNFTAEVPAGVRVRPTCPQTPEQKAQWEVPHRQWLDLTSPQLDYGVSLLNDCKYGGDVSHQQLRLSLLRGSIWPDPEADLGCHHFTYALYPHSGDWRAARTVFHGDRLNCPSRVYFPVEVAGKGILPAQQSLLNLHCHNLGLMALKPLEDNPQQWLLRVYETQGETVAFAPQSWLPLQVEARLDLLERFQSENLQITPWSIASFRISFAK